MSIFINVSNKQRNNEHFRESQLYRQNYNTLISVIYGNKINST